MKYLLDTHILSETLRPQPSKNVQKWLTEASPESLYVSILTLGEIRRGIEKIKACKQKSLLLLWLEQELPGWFGENILPIDTEIAERWGYLTASISSQNPLNAIDSLLAATALTHNCVMVTRNVKDFIVPGLEVVDPFD